ncbi:MAG TPA: (Fe-S)-binding protein [Gammaproteobacteria bacterium]|nr:(Fe-S)-binding protein [Gammaproteobacteria bacterium]
MKNYLDWSAYRDAGLGDAYADIPRHGGDFAKAVAVCINSRVCETTGRQLMCPSFQVSGNPGLSTGGRVRLLKAALSGELPEQALAEPALARAMDLCVACKGCKRECEANVDMALIKAEYLAHRTARQGLALRGRLFAHLPRWLHRHRWLRGLICWRNRSPVLARLGEHVLGLAAACPLPEPARAAFRAPAGAVATGRPGLPGVVLLVDTFTRHFEPQIAEAACAVLAAAGYQVWIAEPEPGNREPDRPLCCGRTYLAQGLVDQARAEAARLATALKPHVDAGRVIVGLEASCVLGLRDDARALGLGAVMTEVGQSVLMFEEFLAKEIMAKRLQLPLRSAADRRLLVHGHCHQKAAGAMKAVRRVLKLVPGLDFRMIGAGCCGMAGTFGIEAEHASLASAMAEHELLPALRANPQADVLASGFSCRQQLRGSGDNRARHLAEVLYRHLDTANPARVRS